MRPIPMKEPRLPRNEIYFLIQMSRSEKDLSRGGHLPPPLPPPSLLFELSSRALLPPFPPCATRGTKERRREKKGFRHVCAQRLRK